MYTPLSPLRKYYAGHYVDPQGSIFMFNGGSSYGFTYPRGGAVLAPLFSQCTNSKGKTAITPP